MPIEVTPLQPDFAAEIGGVFVPIGLTQEDVNAIEQAFCKYSVVVLRNQPLDDEMQEQFIAMFGPAMSTAVLKELSRRQNQPPHLLDIATVDEDGHPLADRSFAKMYMLGNQMWHSDGSQSQPPARLTALSARILPPNPPNTEYADMRAAWDALPAAKKKEIEHLQVEHSILYSRSLIGMEPTESLKAKQPVQHPLVRYHRKSGRKSLYLSSHASHILGWPVEQGRQLLRELTEFATARRFVYVHHWQPHDLVMWDNGCCMHRALPYSDPHPRVLRWSAVRELEPV